MCNFMCSCLKLRIKGIQIRIYKEGVNNFQDILICLNIGNRKDCEGDVLKISVSC